MLALMFNPRFKSMQSVTMYLGCENVVIVVEYDKKLLFLLLMEVNKLLIFNKVETIFDFHSQVYSKILFRTIMTIANTYKDIVSKELVGFWQFPINVKSYKCALSWWCKKKHKFLNIVLLAQHIFGIPINQIETKHIFSIVGIFTTLCKCCL